MFCNRIILAFLLTAFAATSDVRAQSDAAAPSFYAADGQSRPSYYPYDGRAYSSRVNRTPYGANLGLPDSTTPNNATERGASRYAVPPPGSGASAGPTASPTAPGYAAPYVMPSESSPSVANGPYSSTPYPPNASGSPAASSGAPVHTAQAPPPNRAGGGPLLVAPAPTSPSDSPPSAGAEANAEQEGAPESTSNETPSDEQPAASEVVVEEETWIFGPDIDYWIRPVRWEGSVEVGINGSAGNSESFSIQAGFDLKHSDDYFDWASDLNYVKTTTDSAETQHNALFNMGVERKFGDSPWTLFTKSALEYDEFKAWDVRWSLNGGVGYRFWKTDVSKLNGRFGAGVSREFGGPDDDWSPEAVFGLDYKRQISKRQKVKFTADYFPEWGNFSDYRVVTNFAWEYLLDQENNLSLKLDVTDRYDSTPNGRKPNDVNYSLLLLWKT